MSILRSSNDTDGPDRPQWSLFVLSWLNEQDRSQAWLARKAKVHQMHLSNCLLGKVQAGIRILSNLEDAMGMEPGILLMAARESVAEPRNAEK